MRFLAACLALAVAAETGCNSVEHTASGPDLAESPATRDGGHHSPDGGHHSPDLSHVPPPDLGCASGMAACGDLGCRPVGTVVCAAGTTEMTPDGCEVQTCQFNCQWGPYGLAPGKMCGTGGMQTCPLLNCPSDGVQVCQPGCQWGPCICP